MLRFRSLALVMFCVVVAVPLTAQSYESAFPDCIDYSEDLASWLNNGHLFFESSAQAVPSNPDNIYHYVVSIQMKGPDGKQMEIDRYDPWKSNYFHSW